MVIPPGKPDNIASSFTDSLPSLDADLADFCSENLPRLRSYFRSRPYIDDETADDLTIQTAEKFYRRAKTKPGAPWGPLLTKIRNAVYVDHVRKAIRRPKDDSLEDLAEHASYGGSLRPTEDAVIDLEEWASVEQAIRTLSSEKQQIVYLWLNGFDFTEIAEMLDHPMKPKSVNNRFLEARDAIRALLEQEYQSR